MTTATAPTASTSRRTFYICCSRRRFIFTAENVLDAFLTCCTLLVEKAVLVLGPLLICFASSIIGGLSWTFFTILVPMMQRDMDGSPLRVWIVGAHCAFVVFLVVEIVFNYYLCVMTRNKGPNYDRVVRELAAVTNFAYPETPQDVAAFRRHYNDKMVLRMRRRQAREMEQQQLQMQASRSRGGGGGAPADHENNDLAACATNAVTASTATTVMTLDVPAHSAAGPTVRTSSSATGDSTALANGEVTDLSAGTVTQRKTSKQKVAAPPRTLTQPTPKQIRDWMIMAPDEWGFCSRSNQPKPPRAHYDHVSRTLVLCLDHYCPWMFNAVGYFNYRYFCNFLWFVELAMFYGCCMAYRPFVNSSSSSYRKQVLEFRKTGVWTHMYPYTPINTERMPITLSFMLCLAVGVAVLCLAGFHLYLVLTAQTTIEFHGNFVNRARAKRLGQKWRNPYDLGWKRNLQQVYGTQPFLWAFLIPSAREPDFLPLPLPGEDGKRKHLRKQRGDRTKTTVELGHDEEQDGLLKSSGEVEIV